MACRKDGHGPGAGEPAGGTVRREFLYVDDLADSIEFLMKNETDFDLINIGSGIEARIVDYAKFIMEKIGVNLKIKFDKTYPVSPINSPALLPILSLNLPQNGVKTINIAADKETKVFISISLKLNSRPIIGIVCQ